MNDSLQLILRCLEVEIVGDVDFANFVNADYFRFDLLQEYLS